MFPHRNFLTNALSGLFRDVTFALRLARRQPWLVAAVIATVALGVGSNTAITSVLNGVLINPLGLRGADRIMTVRVHLNKLQMQNVDTSGVEFREMQSLADTFSSVAAAEHRAWTVEQTGEPARVTGRAVTPEFFRVFQQRPDLGRFLRPNDHDVIVLSHALWMSSFGGDPNAVGRKILLDGRSFQVVGVAGASFRFPVDAQAWTPLELEPSRLRERGNNMTLLVVARLRPGVTEQQAVDRVHRWVSYLKTTAEGSDLKRLDYGIDLLPIGTFVAGDLRQPLLLLWIAAGILLITGCANVAGLLLSRASGRTREIAIRISIGASSGQIFRQLLTESMLLGLAGGAIGLIFANATLDAATRFAIPGGEMLALVGLHERLLFYGMLLALMSGIVFGVVPALRDSQTSSMARFRKRWFQNSFIGAEVAGAVLLLIVTGLVVKSLWTVETIKPGFDSHGVTTAYILKPPDDPGFLNRLQNSLSSTPGIESAALSNPVPFSGGGFTSMFGIKGHSHRSGEPAWHAEAYIITANYLDALKIPLLRGRNISETDGSGSPLVCLIDAKTADRFFQNEDPLGQYIAMYGGWARIVGVVATVRATSLEDDSRPIVYYSASQIPYFPWMGILVRSRVPGASAIRDAVRRANPRAPVYDIKTMDQRIAESLGIRSIISWLLAAFGLVGILLSAIGVHGIVAQLVSERTIEIGIRMALGAKSAQILSHFLVEGLWPALAGSAVGVIASLLCAGWLRRFLYQVSPLDPATIFGACVTIMVILLFAVWWPSLRAAKIDPQQALRNE
jgi:predicted permease